MSSGQRLSSAADKLPITQGECNADEIEELDRGYRVSQLRFD
jgi:hypothetical protein